MKHSTRPPTHRLNHKNAIHEDEVSLCVDLKPQLPVSYYALPDLNQPERHLLLVGSFSHAL